MTSWFPLSALFTSVPVDRSLEVTRDLLLQDDTLSSRTSLSVGHVIKLLELCLRSTYSMFDGQIYSQVEGAPMGSPLSPIVANLSMQWFEETSLETFPYEISLWKRYVDDTIVILIDAFLDDFTAHISAVHPSCHLVHQTGRRGWKASSFGRIYLEERGQVIDLFGLSQADPYHAYGPVPPVLQQPVTTAQVGDHKDVGPSVCHYLQGQGIPDPGDTSFEESAKCLMIHRYTKKALKI